jgi:predicted transcriptional regulator
MKIITPAEQHLLSKITDYDLLPELAKELHKKSKSAYDSVYKHTHRTIRRLEKNNLIYRDEEGLIIITRTGKLAQELVKRMNEENTARLSKNQNSI